MYVLTQGKLPKICAYCEMYFIPIKIVYSLKTFTWTLISSPFPEVPVTQTSLPVVDALFAATSLGGGVWDAVPVLALRVLSPASVEEEWTETASATLLITSPLRLAQTSSPLFRPLQLVYRTALAFTFLRSLSLRWCF